MTPQLEDTEKKGKSKSAKGAPRPRKERGRTINRRRDRFIRKMAAKLAKIQETDYEPSVKAAMIAEVKSAMALSQNAQARHTSKVGKK